jgi:hypothetical protein
VSDTDESKSLRGYAFEVAVARSLTQHVFRPLFPLPNADPHISTLERALHEICKSSSGACFRSIISSANSEMLKVQKESLQETIKTEVVEICEPLLRLLSDSQRSEFNEEFSELLENSIITWEQAQRSGLIVEATLEQNPNQDWTWGVPEELNMPEEYHKSARVEAVLFPGVFQTHAPAATAICSGRTIWTDFAIFEDGKKEFHIQEVRAHDSVRPYTARVRP